MVSSTVTVRARRGKGPRTKRQAKLRRARLLAERMGVEMVARGVVR